MGPLSFIFSMPEHNPNLSCLSRRQKSRRRKRRSRYLTHDRLPHFFNVNFNTFSTSFSLFLLINRLLLLMPLFFVELFFFIGWKCLQNRWYLLFTYTIKLCIYCCYCLLFTFMIYFFNISNCRSFSSTFEQRTKLHTKLIFGVTREHCFKVCYTKGIK